MKKFPSKLHVTKPNLITTFYFNRMYEKIIEIGKFNEEKTILDFGSGLGLLKQKNLQRQNSSIIINYDVIKELSDVEDWKSINFDTIVFCEVLYLIDPEDLKKLLNDLRIINSKVEIICVISTQSIINKVASKLLGHPDAHGDTKTHPKLEREILLNHCNLLDNKKFFNLFNVLKFNFK